MPTTENWWKPSQKTESHTAVAVFTKHHHHHHSAVKLWMLHDSVSHCCLALSTYWGAKTEDRAEIKQFGLAYQVMMKLLKIGNYLSKGTCLVKNYATEWSGTGCIRDKGDDCKCLRNFQERNKTAVCVRRGQNMNKEKEDWEPSVLKATKTFIDSAFQSMFSK